jgi:hypothetical protein
MDSSQQMRILMPVHQSHLLWTKYQTTQTVATKMTTQLLVRNMPSTEKTRADIITMNATLTDVFLDAISIGVRAAFQQRRLHAFFGAVGLNPFLMV